MKWFFHVLIFFFAGQSLVAGTTELKNKVEKEIQSVEEKINRLELEVGLKHPPYRTTFNFHGDFLYWKASLDGVAYATTAVTVVNADGSDGFDRFKTKTVHFNYDPGFAIGAGIGLPYDQWDLAVQWLRFHTTGRDKTHGSLSEAAGHRVILDRIGMIESLLSPPRKAKADCRVHLDVVDLVAGRAFYWSKYFEFRPFAGLRAAWIDIDWDIAFRRPIFRSFPLDQTYASLEVDNDYHAIGLLGGFESEWTFFKGFGLFSYSTASLIYGESSERTKEKFFLVPAMESNPVKQTLRASNSTHTVKAVFDLALGLKWDIRFKERYRFQIRAGYDFFYWPNITQKTVVQSTRIRDRADLSFQGLIIGAKFEF